MVHHHLLRLHPGVSVELVLYKSKTDDVCAGRSAHAGPQLHRYCPVKDTVDVACVLAKVAAGAPELG